MNFDWAEEDRDLKTRIGRILGDGARQELESLDEADLPSMRRTACRYLRLLAEVGYLGYGLGPANRDQVLTLLAGQEELAMVSGSLFLSVEVTARLFGGLVAGFGDPEQVGDLRRAVERGEIIAAVAVSEPAEPGAPAGVRTQARSESDHYVVSGKKDFVTNGPLADWFAVAGRVGEQAAVFLVEAASEGVTIGPRIRTLGYNGLAVSSLELTDVNVPRSRTLGPFEDTGPLEFVRLMEDLLLSIASIALIHRATYTAKKHAGAHERAGKPVIAHQEVRFKLAEMLTLQQTAQLLTYRAGWMYSNADPETTTLVHCAKVFSAEASERVSNLAMQIMAGQGYVWGNIVERAYRESKYAALAGTTSELARMAIAEDLLARYR
jgi:alkylation response protein AidB-like acyl-CoA dehydrogenase